MNPRWLTHFKLKCPPFSKELDDAELWVPSSRAHLLDELDDGCQERGHMLLTGEPGVGKTCVLRALRRRLPEAGFRLTYCHNATLGRRDFYRQLCLALGLSPKATAAGVFYEVSSHIQQLGQERVHPVFLLDEAICFIRTCLTICTSWPTTNGIRAPCFRSSSSGFPNCTTACTCGATGLSFRVSTRA